MKIQPSGGVLTDFPPLASDPFWFRSSNIRFRFGLPQTVGLFSRFMDTRSGRPVDELLVNFISDGSAVDFHADDNLLLIASGTRLAIVLWNEGSVDIRSVSGVGSSGRWWFTSTEEDIIAGRSNLDGRAVAINRETRVIRPIPNVPQGCIGGGITAGVLMLAGTESIGNSPPKMVVRWSARRGDPSSSGTADGPFGFEDWTPSDLNASGEFRLENGSRIKAAGATVFGFIVWTDTAAFEITGRTDLFVFAETQISGRGIMAPRAWVVADDRLWWFDHTRTLNVYDGGRPRQVLCPLSGAISETIPDTDLDRVSLSSDLENGEISLHFPGPDGQFRELVYNYREDAWYVFDLDRMNLVPSSGPRPSIGMDGRGRLMFYDLREIQPCFGCSPSSVPVPLAPAPAPLAGPFAPAAEPEPFTFWLETNWITAGNSAVQSWRGRNIVLAHTYSRSGPFGAQDMLTMEAFSRGELDLQSPPLRDHQQAPVGAMLFHLRFGGKAVALRISGVDVRSLVRFGAIDVEADEAGKR